MKPQEHFLIQTADVDQFSLKEKQTSSDLPIDLHHDSRAKVVEDKGLVGLRKSEFPWQSSMFDAGPAAGTCSAIMS